VGKQLILYQVVSIHQHLEGSSIKSDLFVRKNVALRFARRTGGTVKRMVVQIKSTLLETLRPDEMPNWWWDNITQNQNQ
jgi:hypothetical protein